MPMGTASAISFAYPAIEGSVALRMLRMLAFFGTLFVLLPAAHASSAQREFTSYTSYCAQFKTATACEWNQPPGVAKTCHCQWMLYPHDRKPHYPDCYYLPYEQGGSRMCPDDPEGFLHRDEL
eukprot:TRINITY_DN69513_c0_g1_i1.p1 TRINITY_DN69513_c0_g1~~TRINITY_DN69513_c0_g1_i1.p1  ORF type:complete len:123 (-),score=14.19 TRINITY_DN69513_c0_g1_i1:257-625(-)